MSDPRPRTTTPQPEPAAPPQMDGDVPTGGEPVALARPTLVMAAGTVLSRLTGFLRLFALAVAAGITEGPLADAYNRANVTPNIIYELVLGGVLSSVLVPVFVETLQRDRAGSDGTRHTEHQLLVNTVTTLTLCILGIVCMLAILAAPALAVLLTLRVDGTPVEVAALRQVVTLFLRLFLPQVVFYGLTTVWTAYLNAHRRFAAPMFAPVLNNLVVTAVLLAFGASVRFTALEDLRDLSAAQLWLLGVGTTAGIVAMTVPLWPVARRQGWRWRPSFDWRNPMIRRILRLGGWAVLYVVVNQAGYLVVIVLTGGIVGGYTAYVVAFTFFQLPHAVYAVSVMTALVPAMAAAASSADRDAFRAHVGRGVRATALLIVPAAVGLGVLAQPIVHLLLEYGVLSPASTRLVARVLLAFVLGLPSFSLFQLFLRANYALQDTRTPLLVNVAAVAFNIAADVALFLMLPPGWKIAGLALGHALAYSLGAMLFATRLRRRLGGLEGRLTAHSLTRVVAAAAVMGVVVAGAREALVALLGDAALLGRAAQVAIPVIVGAAVYLVVARAFGLRELTGAAALVRARLLRR